MCDRKRVNILFVKNLIFLTCNEIYINNMIQIMHLECTSMLPGKGHTTFCIFITPILEKKIIIKITNITEKNHLSEGKPINEAISVY